MSRHQPATCCLLPPEIGKRCPSPVTRCMPHCPCPRSGALTPPHSAPPCRTLRGLGPPALPVLRAEGLDMAKEGVALFLSWAPNGEGGPLTSVLLVRIQGLRVLLRVPLSRVSLSASNTTPSLDFGLGCGC